MSGQLNARAFAEDNTGQNTDQGHTPNPKTEIKIPDPPDWKAGTLPTTPRLRINYNKSLTLIQLSFDRIVNFKRL